MRLLLLSCGSPGNPIKRKGDYGFLNIPGEIITRLRNPTAGNRETARPRQPCDVPASPLIMLSSFATAAETHDRKLEYFAAKRYYRTRNYYIITCNNTVTIYNIAT